MFQLLEVRDCHSKPGEDSHDDYDNYLDMLAAVWFSLAERPRQRGFNGNQYVYHTSRAFALDLDSCHLFMLPNVRKLRAAIIVLLVLNGIFMFIENQYHFIVMLCPFLYFCRDCAI